MALIKCPECGKEVSDKANNCLNCGYPLNNDNAIVNEIKEQSRQEKIDKTNKMFKIFLILAIVCTCAWIIMFLWQAGNASTISNASAGAWAASLGSHILTNYEKRIITIDNTFDILKKILILPIIFFSIMSAYYYKIANNLKIGE
jgi:ribosomal protein L37E